MSRLLIGDVRDVLPTLAEESAQMCVTSPPHLSVSMRTWRNSERHKLV